MQLTDQFYIEDVKTLHPLEIEPLYWVVEDSLHKGEVSKAKSIYKAFLYIATYRPDLLKELRPHQIQRLKDIAYELHSDHVINKKQVVELKFECDPKSIRFAKESELRNYLCEHPEILSNVLEEYIFITGSEIKIDHEYRCDILAESRTKRYPIELKIVQAKHGVISQIQKYLFYFYRKFRYSQYKDLQGIVIANGFDAFSINELRKNGILCFDLITQDDHVKLVKI